MGLRVFLTGASGYLGGVLAERLSRLPEVDSITGIGRSTPRQTTVSRMSFLRLDVRSPDLGRAVAGHDVLIHAAGIVLWPVAMPERLRDEINLDGARNVGRAAVANNIRRVVHASSMAAYDPVLARGQTDISEDFPLGDGSSRFYYWNSKAGAEKALQEALAGSSVVLTHLRPIYIVGPRGLPLLKRYRENAVNFPRRNPRRQFIHEHDVADAFAQALLQDLPGAYNVVPDDYIRMKDVWRILGIRRVKTVPLSLARIVTWLRWRLLGSAIHPSWVEDVLVDFTGSNRKLRQAGWEPRYNSAQALEAAAQTAIVEAFEPSKTQPSANG